MRLHRGDQCVTDLVVCNRLLFLIGQHGVLFLVARDDDLDGFFQICFRDHGPVVAHGAQGCFVDHVCQLRAGCAGRHTRNRVEIHIVARFDLLCVNLQNCLAPGKIRKLHGYAPVEASGARERRVQRFGTVRRGENDDAIVIVKAVHFSQQLV